MSGGGHIFTTYDLANLDPITGNPQVRFARNGARAERFTVEKASDPRTVAEALNRVQADHASLAARQPGRMLCFLGVTLDSTNVAKPVITHRLNAYVVWWVVGWRGLTNNSAVNIHDDRADATVQSDLNTLWLRSFSAGTADIMVMEVP